MRLYNYEFPEIHSFFYDKGTSFLVLIRNMNKINRYYSNTETIDSNIVTSKMNCLATKKYYSLLYSFIDVITLIAVVIYSSNKCESYQFILLIQWKVQCWWENISVEDSYIIPRGHDRTETVESRTYSKTEDRECCCNTQSEDVVIDTRHLLYVDISYDDIFHICYTKYHKYHVIRNMHKY